MKSPDFVNYDCRMKELILNGAEWRTRDDVRKFQLDAGCPIHSRVPTTPIFRVT